MAKITEFSLGCSKVINLGNYQNIKIEASLVVSLDPGETLADASATAQNELRQLLEQTYQAQLKHAQSLL